MDSYVLPQFISTNGLTLSLLSDNTKVVTIEEQTLTPVAIGSSVVAMETVKGIDDRFEQLPGRLPAPDHHQLLRAGCHHPGRGRLRC